MTKPRLIAKVPKRKGFWYIEERTVYFIPWMNKTMLYGNFFGFPIKIATLRKGEVGVFER